MGYQQSFVKFKDVGTLRNELSKYKQRDTRSDSASVYGVAKTIKSLPPFKKGELALIIGGERYAQRGKSRLKDELGIENAQEIVFIDNPRFWDISGGDIGTLLEAHFINLTEKEVENVLEEGK